jgi:hypothetical protein
MSKQGVSGWNSDHEDGDSSSKRHHQAGSKDGINDSAGKYGGPSQGASMKQINRHRFFEHKKSLGVRRLEERKYPSIACQTHNEFHPECQAASHASKTSETSEKMLFSKFMKEKRSAELQGGHRRQSLEDAVKIPKSNDDIVMTSDMDELLYIDPLGPNQGYPDWVHRYLHSFNMFCNYFCGLK